MITRLGTDIDETAMKMLLACDGMCVGDVMVPPFEVFTGDYVGLTIPTDYGIQWAELMQSLGGSRQTSKVHLAGRSSVIGPLGFQPLETTIESQRLIDVALARGFPRASAETTILSLGLEPERAYSSLQLTPRLLLELRLAWGKGAELVVFSSAGLDPSGILAVAAEVSQVLDQCAAIHTFSAALTQHYESLSSFVKLVRCTERKKRGHN